MIFSQWPSQNIMENVFLEHNKYTFEQFLREYQFLVPKPDNITSDSSVQIFHVALSHFNSHVIQTFIQEFENIRVKFNWENPLSDTKAHHVGLLKLFSPFIMEEENEILNALRISRNESMYSFSVFS